MNNKSFFLQLDSMSAFDNNKISNTVYSAHALPLDSFLSSVMEKSPVLGSYPTYISCDNKQAIIPFDFMYKIVSNSLLPRSGPEEVKKIVSSQYFNLDVNVKRIELPANDKRKNTNLNLTSQKGSDILSFMKFPVCGDYVGLPEKIFNREGFFPDEKLAVFVKPDEIIKWKSYEERKLLEKKSYEEMTRIIDEFVRRPGFEPGS